MSFANHSECPARGASTLEAAEKAELAADKRGSTQITLLFSIGVHRRLSAANTFGANRISIRCPHCDAAYLTAETLREIDQIKAHQP